MMTTLLLTLFACSPTSTTTSPPQAPAVDTADQQVAILDTADEQDAVVDIADQRSRRHATADGL